MKTITRTKGGTGEREVEVNKIQIPDLWHTAMLFFDADQLYQKQQAVKAELPYPDDNPELNNVTISIKGNMATKIKDDILETWSLCHDLRNAVHGITLTDQLKNGATLIFEQLVKAIQEKKT